MVSWPLVAPPATIRPLASAPPGVEDQRVLVLPGGGVQLRLGQQGLQVGQPLPHLQRDLCPVGTRALLSQLVVYGHSLLVRVVRIVVPPPSSPGLPEFLP